jgi:hypothetical protein
MRLSGILLIATLSLSCFGQGAPPSPSRARIICLFCGKPAPGAETPFTPRKTVLGQPLGVIEPQLAHQAGTKPIIIETPRTTIVAAVEGGPVDDVSPAELEYLQGVFPALKGIPTSLDAHQQAHLLAARCRRIEKELADILELDPDGRVRTESGPYQPLSSSHVEVFVFSKPAGYEVFTSFLFEKSVNPLVGAMLESGPTSAMVMPSLKEPGARCQFIFTTTLQLLAGLSRGGTGLQPWIRCGLARVLEDRHAPASVRSPAIAPALPGVKPSNDWNAFAADMIVGGKVGDMGALASTPLAGLSYRSEVQAWSLVRWMIEKDKDNFARLVRLLLHSPPDEAPPKALLNAMRAAYGHDLVTVLDEWKEAVRKSRVSK